jgi:hypothetical protein
MRVSAYVANPAQHCIRSRRILRGEVIAGGDQIAERDSGPADADSSAAALAELRLLRDRMDVKTKDGFRRHDQ